MKTSVKKTLSILIVICMLIAAVPFTVSAATTTVNSWSSLASAVSSASSGDVIVLGADMTASEPIYVNTSVKIIGGKTITRSSSCADSVFIINGALTLENTTINGNRTGTATAELANALVVVNQNAYFTMNTGAVLTTNRANAAISGAGVTVAGGTFTMNDGAEIRDMHVHNVSASNSLNVGPAVYIVNGSFTMDGGLIRYCDGRVGAVSNFGGTFTMNGGTISDSIGNNYGEGGGAVYNTGTFTMNGGTITNNTSWLKGGGVYNSGTFNLINGEISSNTVVLEGSTTCDAGGVYNSGTFTMSGGKIKNNNAQNCAGGVLVAGGTFTLSGGEISSNTTSTYSGGGVFVSGGSFAMNGGSIVNNTAKQYGGGIAVTANTATPINVSAGKILGNTCGANQCGSDIYVTTSGSVASTTLGTGCVTDSLYLDNQGNRYSASNATLAPSSTLTANYGYIYVTNGASHTFGEWTVTEEPGCTTTGIKTRTCSVCGTVETDVVPAKGHNTVAQSVNPTCTEDGYTRYYCPVCGIEHSRIIVPATGHIAGNWKVVTKAESGAPGVKAAYCKSCGIQLQTASYTVNDPMIKVSFSEPAELDSDFNTITATVSIDNNPGIWALGFYMYYDPEFSVVSYENGTVLPGEYTIIGDTEIDVANDNVASSVFATSGDPVNGVTAYSYYDDASTFANVTTNGTLYTVTFKYSADLEGTYQFGFAYDPDFIIDAEADNVDLFFENGTVEIEPIINCDHAAGAWTVATAPTCTESGLRTKACTICGRILEREVIPPTGHTAGDWVVTVQPGTEEGQRVKYCTSCGIVLETETLRPTQRINVYAEDVTAAAGSSVETEIYLENNTGIWGGRIFVYYPEQISVTSVDVGPVFDGANCEIGPLNFDPYTNEIAHDAFEEMGITESGIRTICIYFESTSYANVTANGKLATLTFSIPQGTLGEFDVKIVSDDAINANLDDIELNCYNYKITSVDCLHANTSWQVTTAPTCTESGVRSLICSDCGAVLETETIQPNGHTFSSEWTVDIEPTETTPGQKSRHCLYCDAVTDVTEIEPLIVIMLGDVNGDGKVNSRDLALFKRYLADPTGTTGVHIENCDLNNDGKINSRDISVLKRYLSNGTL